MVNGRLPEDDPNYESFLNEADLPYSDVGDTTGFDVYRLSGNRGIGFYRTFTLEDDLPGLNFSSEKFYGVEVEQMGEDRDNVMLIRSTGSNYVFEYRDNNEQPSEIRELGELGPVNSNRIIDMLNGKRT